MRHPITASVLFVLALAMTATGQPPAGQPPAAPKTKTADDQVAKKPDATDAAIAAALANDPDVKMAKAKIQLAEAELAKARQTITLKVVALKAKIEQLKVEVKGAEERAKFATAMFERGTGDHAQVLLAREKLEAVKAGLATAEAEWKLLISGANIGLSRTKVELNDDVQLGAFLGMYNESMTLDKEIWGHYLAVRKLGTVKGPIPERIRTILDKPVKLGAKGEKITFEKALEVFRKDAGLDVPVRGAFPTRAEFNPKNPNQPTSHPIEIVLEGEELPVGAWLQLFEDNAVFPQRAGAVMRFRFYVREYGLLIASTESAPLDAPALIEFWKHKPAAKETKTEPAPKQ